jgi:hypothetical protein
MFFGGAIALMVMAQACGADAESVPVPSTAPDSDASSGPAGAADAALNGLDGGTPSPVEGQDASVPDGTSSAEADALAGVEVDGGSEPTEDVVATPPQVWTAPCMGATDHCARPYNQFAQVCTHNAMSNGEDGFTLPAPNQAYSFTTQLDDGVRCMMLDTYEHNGAPYLCHGVCGIWGERPLLDGLQEIAAWMTAHPREVVTFIMQSNLDEDVFHQSLVDAGLAAASGEPTEDDVLYFHDAPPGTPWPLLGEMVDQNQRLVVFTDDPSANGSWHLDWQIYGWETPYGDDSFSCEDGRGDPTAYDNQVFILNHYTLCVQGGCLTNALDNNALAFALERAQMCWQVDAAMNPWGQIPTFINVDNYHAPTIGGRDDKADIFEVVEQLNSMWPGPP